jgi:UDP-N-acetyl-2-amino-2-deoxyglucuronate dehydrogenase
MKIKFAIIGASGYIAPRHMKAISEIGGELIAVCDPYDAIGVIDSYFPQADFFTDFDKFAKFINDYNKTNAQQIEYVSICSPNYLHFSHIKFVLSNNINVICEKPLVLNPEEIEQIKIFEKNSNKKVYTILQLRLHPSVIELKNSVNNILKEKPDAIYDVDLRYITSRGKWYFTSWKGDIEKSGGITFNIGIHFFDMLNWIFGDIKENIVHFKSKDTACGFMRLKNARVKWFLSINGEYLPKEAKDNNKTTYRSITIDDKQIEFSDGFTDLHTTSYDKILSGDGFKIKETYNCINNVFFIKNAKIDKSDKNIHSFYKNIISK